MNQEFCLESRLQSLSLEDFVSALIAASDDHDSDVIAEKADIQRITKTHDLDVIA